MSELYSSNKNKPASDSTYTNTKFSSLDIDGVINLINTNVSLFVIPASIFPTNLKVLCINKNVSSAKVRIAHIDGAIGTLSNEDYLFYDALLLPGETKEIIIPGAFTGDTFMVRSDTTLVSFVLSSELRLVSSYKRIAAFDIDGATNLINTNYGILTTTGSQNTDFQYVVCNRNSADVCSYRLALIDGATVSSLGNDDYILWEELILESESQMSDNFLHANGNKTIMFRSDKKNINIVVYGNVQS